MKTPRACCLLGLVLFVALGCRKQPSAQRAATSTGQRETARTTEDVQTQSREKGAKNRLLEAAERGDPALVARLLADGVDVDARDRFDRTPLHRAAGCGHKDIVELLIAHGADIDAADGYGFTPFHEALARRNADVVKLLIARGADVATRAYNGQTPLHVAPEHAIGIVRTLLSRGAEVNARTRTGQTPLLRAVEAGSLEVVQLLLSHGADPNVVGRCDDRFLPHWVPLGEGDRYFASPLHVAVELNSTAKVRLLLESGANPNLPDSLGRLPTTVAMQRRRKEIAELLVRYGAETTLHLAAYTGMTDKVRQFIDADADVDGRDDKGQTPLHMAVSGGRIEAAELLVAADADVNVSDESGWTPLHEAAFQGLADIVRLLLASGAKVDVKAIGPVYREPGLWYTSGTTPLHAAAHHVDVAGLLVQSGADLNAVARYGQTPLEKAVFHGNKQVARLLIDAGADITIHLAALVGHADSVRGLIDSGVDVNAKNDDDETPLYLAARGGHAEVADILMAHGADPNARCGWNYRHPMYWSRPRPEDFDSFERDGTPAEPGSGLTALHHAAELGFRDVAEILIARGADVNARDPLGRTPLHAAAYAGWGRVVGLLLSSEADADAADRDGRTALDYAREAGFREVCALLAGGRDDPLQPRRGPRRVIITDPNAVRAFLGWEGIAHDSAWVPADDDLDGLDNILRVYLRENIATGAGGDLPREPVLSHLRRYHREYGGFIRDGRRHILCNMFVMGPRNMVVSASSANQFTVIADGYWCVVRAVFDLEARALVEIQCNGAA